MDKGENEENKSGKLKKARNFHNILLAGKNSNDSFASMVKARARGDGQKEYDLVLVADMYLRGYTHQQIVDELSRFRFGEYEYTKVMLDQDIESIHARWIVSYIVDFDKAKARELAHIDALEREYWNAWRKSQGNNEETETERVEDKHSGQRVNMPGFSRTRVRKVERKRDGNDLFLKGIQWCIEQRCKILGLAVNVMTRNINVNWRKEAEAIGIDPDGALNELVDQFVAAASVGRTSGGGSLEEGTEDYPGQGTDS